MNALYLVLVFSTHPLSSYSLVEDYTTCNPNRPCMSKQLSSNDIEKHFNTSSDLFFLFGINVYRPFINEHDQTYAETSLFIVVVCKANSSDCISNGDSLPFNYRLEFRVGGVSFNNTHSNIDGRWHRTKDTNYELLYEPLHAHAWYVPPDKSQISIWHNFVMQMNSHQNESLYSKWVEFDVSISNAGIQFIEGQQIYNGSIVQQFTLHFFVPTFECPEPPTIHFDGLISTKSLATRKIHLSAFHFQVMSLKCDLHVYSCHLHMKRMTQEDVSNSMNITFHRTNTVNVTIYDSTLYVQNFMSDQASKSTALVDRTSEQAIIEQQDVTGNFLSFSNVFRRNATCINKNPITSREFLLCTQACLQGEHLTPAFRVDIVQCMYSYWNADRCTYSLFSNFFNESLRLFVPVKTDNITFIRFLRLSKDLPDNEWIVHLDEDFHKISDNELAKTYDHTVKLRVNIHDDDPIIRQYQIITDQMYMCHLVCRSDCMQKSANHSDYFVSQQSASNLELIFFCPNCQFEEIRNQLSVHLGILSFINVTRDIVLIRLDVFRIGTQNRRQMSVKCINEINETMIIDARFYLIDRQGTQALSCSIDSPVVRAYHDEIILECESSVTRVDVIVWAITVLEGEQVRIWLNPFYLANEISSSKIRIQLQGIPHGDKTNGNKLRLEIISPLLNVTRSYELITIDPDDKLIPKINTALEWNYFTSAFHLMNEYFKIHESDLNLLNDPANPRLQLTGLNQTSFLMCVINFHHLILNYLDQELLYEKAADFSQKIYSDISIRIFKYQTLYPETGNIYLNHMIALLIQLAARPRIIIYQTYHMLRHTMQVFSYRLPDTSLAFLRKLFDLCINLRVYIIDSKSMPTPTAIDANSLLEFNGIIGKVLTMIHAEFTSRGYFDRRTHYSDKGPFDSIVNMQAPFITRRWTLEFHRMTSNQSNNTGPSNAMPTLLGIVYYPQEYIPLYTRNMTSTYVDYLIGQMLSLQSNNSSPDFLSEIRFSLRQTYLNPSTLLTNYYYLIHLAHSGKNQYSHTFIFQMNTTQLARNLSMLFLDLPNSYQYTLTIELTYNEGCVESEKVFKRERKYQITVDLWDFDYFVYSIPIKPLSRVCAHVEIASAHSSIRNSKRIGKFVAIETGCYSFDTPIYEDYVSQLRSDQCQLINENERPFDNSLFTGPHLTCHCQPMIHRYFVLCQPKSIRIESELSAQIWLYLYAYICLLLLIFLLLGLYAIYYDTQDDQKPTVHFVSDNPVGATRIHLYQLNMFTGLQQAASRNAKIYVRLIGEKRHDVSHCLNLNLPNGFQRGGVDQFLLTSFVDLGRIVALNIWLGEADTHSDFYIRHCILYDYSDHQTYYFCCYTWLSLMKGANIINEIFFLAQEVDQYAFGHLFIATFAWLYYHFYLINSIFFKQKSNSFSRIGRVHLYFCLQIIQLYMIQTFIIACRQMISNRQCINIFSSFLFVVDQSFAVTGWMKVSQVVRSNFIPSLFVAFILSAIAALLTPVLIWSFTWFTNRIDLYRQLVNTVTHAENIDALHSIFYAIASSATDLDAYYADINQFECIHKFDLQHRWSESTIADDERNQPEIPAVRQQSRIRIDTNDNAADEREFVQVDKTRRRSFPELPIHLFSNSVNSLNANARVWKDRQLKVGDMHAASLGISSSNIHIHEVGKSQRVPILDKDSSMSSYLTKKQQKTRRHQSNSTMFNTIPDDLLLPTSRDLTQTAEQSFVAKVPMPVTRLKIDWPTASDRPSYKIYLLYSIIYYGILIILSCIAILGMFATMKTFVEIDNYFVTSSIILIHALTILLTLIFELVIITIVSLLNAAFFRLTDEDKFVAAAVEIPVASLVDLEQQPLTLTSGLSCDITQTDIQLRERIRERILESSIIRAVRDVIGYIVFMIIIIMVFAETSQNVETRLAMRQYTFQLLLREGIFQEIDTIPETMDWIRYFIENRLFLEHKHYSCSKDTCNYVQIPDSPLYLSKSIRVRQVRVERSTCHKQIDSVFRPSTPPTCFVGGTNLMDDETAVIGGQRSCSGWQQPPPGTQCQDTCNYTSVWSAMSYKRMTKLYHTHESPWYFIFHLSPKETVQSCNRKRKYYDLSKYGWLDEKTLVVLIEGNMFSPQASAMISFVLTIKRNEYGIVEKEIFVEVSDYILTTVDNQRRKSISVDGVERQQQQQPVLTHYLFAALLFVIFITKLVGLAKFTRNFGLYGFVFFLRTLSNMIDGILLILCCYYFLLFYLDHQVLQISNIMQALDIHRLFVSFRVLIVNNAIVNHLIGTICLVAIFKLLNLLKFNPKTFLLAETIRNAASGFIVLLTLAFVNYLIFAIIARLLFPMEKNFESFLEAFRVVLVSSIKDTESTESIIPPTASRALWQFFLWLFSAKIIEYFLISFVIQEFSNVRKHHQLTDEERIVGRLFKTFLTYFAFDKQKKMVKNKFFLTSDQ